MSTECCARRSSKQGPALLMCVLLATTAFVGCESRLDPETSHQRMLVALDEIRKRSVYEDEYYEDASVRLAEKQLAGLPPQAPDAERFELHWQLGDDLLRLGRNEQAISHFARAYEIAPQVRESLSDEQWHLLLRDMAVAYLRMGETENCIHCRTGESCILPIRGTGIHQHQQGSRKAIEHFKILLAEYPDDMAARWLLNVAYMTVGEYPDEVPPEFLIPESAFASTASFPRFQDIAEELGLKTLDCSGGVVIDDFDGDDDLDIVVSTWDRRGEMHFFRNDGRGRFTDRTKDAGLKGLYGGLNLLQADYDNDGDLDILVLRGAWLGRTVGKHPNSLLQNDGRGRFRDVTFAAGLGEQHFPTQTATWADFDQDGDLDLYIGNELCANQLFLNNGDGTFTDIAATAGVENDARWAKGVVSGDYDGDGWPDLYVSNLGADNRLYRNNGDLTFTDVAPKLNTVAPRLSFPVWFWDYNNDGNLDIYAPSYEVGVQHVARDFLGLPSEAEADCLYEGDGQGGFREVAAERNLNRTTQPMGCNFGDLDNDGFLDFYLGTGYVEYHGLMPNLMFRNIGGQRFVDVTIPGGFGHLQKGHGTAFADLDGDGDQDVFIQMGGANPGDAFGNVLFQNPGFGNNWIKIRLVGRQTNRSAIGARIRVSTDDDSGPRNVYRWVNSGGSFGANPLEQHIGLGSARSIGEIEIHWPTSGLTQSFQNVRVNQAVKITEGVSQLQIVAPDQTSGK